MSNVVVFGISRTDALQMYHNSFDRLLHMTASERATSLRCLGYVDYIFDV